MFDVKIDDRQVKKFMKKSPARANWASSEALKATGGHYRKKLRHDIEHGKIGGPKKLSDFAMKTRDNPRRPPLYQLGRLVRFKVSRSNKKGVYRLWIGFLTKKKKKGMAQDHMMSIPKLAKIHEGGKRVRVTPEMRRYAARKGIYIRKTTKTLKIPQRQMIDPFWKNIHSKAPKYFERKFFSIFFSKRNPRLGI